MKVYEYTVCTLTSRGKEIPHFRKVIKTEMDISGVRNFLNKKYTGFYVKVEEVVDIEEIETDNKNVLDIVEKYYQKCINTKIELKEFPELNKKLTECLAELDKTKTIVKDKIREYLEDEIKFNVLIGADCLIDDSKIFITGYLPINKITDWNKNETTKN